MFTASTLATGTPEPTSRKNAAPADADTVDHDGFDGTIEIPKTDFTIKLDGYVKVDLIHDFDAIGSTDSFDTSTIPTDGREGENTRFHAKESRANLEIRGPSRRGAVRIFVEGDFFTSDNSFRLRHAYGEVGRLLVGQTWSTFMDEDMRPPTLDFEAPRTYLNIRQAMIRWTQPLSKAVYLAVALEEPASEITPPAGVAGESEHPLPDLTARLRWKHERGHLQSSMFVGGVRFRSDAGPIDDETIWGLNLSGSMKAFQGDRLRFQLAYGEGLTRYRGGLAAAPDATGRLEALGAFSATLSYQHHWSEALSTHVVYSLGTIDNSAGQDPDANHATEYAALNLVWKYTERVSIGAEWLYGTREDNDGARGEANRLLVAIRFDFF